MNRKRQNDSLKTVIVVCLSLIWKGLLARRATTTTEERARKGLGVWRMMYVLYEGRSLRCTV